MTTYLKEDFLYDADLVLEDSLDTNGDVEVIDGVDSYAGSVLAVDTVIDVGDGLVEGYMIVDIDDIEPHGNDELYIIKLQGNNDGDFADATAYDLAQISIGAGEVLANGTGGTDVGAAGDRFVVPFRNEQNGTVYRYVRCIQVLTGSLADITDTIWLSIKR